MAFDPAAPVRAWRFQRVARTGDTVQLTVQRVKNGVYGEATRESGAVAKRGGQYVLDLNSGKRNALLMVDPNAAAPLVLYTEGAPPLGVYAEGAVYHVRDFEITSWWAAAVEGKVTTTLQGIQSWDGFVAAVARLLDNISRGMTVDEACKSMEPGKLGPDKTKEVMISTVLREACSYWPEYLHGAALIDAVMALMKEVGAGKTIRQACCALSEQLDAY